MKKVFSAIIKELILLRRDLFGLIIIFLMPVILILTITPIQYSIESQDNQAPLPILLVNNDQGELSREMIKKLAIENNILFIQEKEGAKLTIKQAKELIENGRQKVLMIIPSHFSSFVQAKINHNVSRLLSQVMPNYSGNLSNISKNSISKEIKMFFDPIINKQIKSSIHSDINRITSSMETQMIYKTFEKEFNADLSFMQKQDLISFKEYTLSVANLKPTPIQHNMPAWALFAMFLIVVPLSINMVKEKNQGTFVRLKVLPVSSFQLMLGKIVVYLIVCMIQFYLMLLVSIFIFPWMGLPPLEIGGKIISLSIVALFAGIAAVGFGVLIGTVAKTLEQAAPFGSMAVVILAAIGGLWFPVYAMSSTMQKIAMISPMNWGLEAFYNVLLRNADFISLIPYLFLLLLFFILSIVISVFYEKNINLP